MSHGGNLLANQWPQPQNSDRLGIFFMRSRREPTFNEEKDCLFGRVRPIIGIIEIVIFQEIGIGIGKIKSPKNQLESVWL